MQTAKKRSKIKLAKRILFIVILLVLITILILQVFAPRHAVQVIGIGVFIGANTNSMLPDIAHNHLIIATRARFDELEIGDTVVFASTVLINGGERTVFITHTIINTHVANCGELQFITRGINANGADRQPLTRDGANGTNKFIGRVVATNRTVGFIFAYLTSPFGIVAIIITIIGVLLVVKVVKLDK